MHTAEYFIKNQIMKIYDVPLYSRKLDFQKQKSLPSLSHFKSTGAEIQSQKFSKLILTG